MDIKRNGSQASIKGPAECFTGPVRVDRLFDGPPARGSGAYVTFEPCSRIHWHTHAEQLPFHLKKARDNGLSEAELIETITIWRSIADGPRP